MTVVTFGEVQQEETKVVHKIGNWYKHYLDGSLYLLCRCADRRVALVNADCGNYWNDPIMVQDEHNISLENMQEITCGYFTLVHNINIQEV